LLATNQSCRRGALAPLERANARIEKVSFSIGIPKGRLITPAIAIYGEAANPCNSHI